VVLLGTDLDDASVWDRRDAVGAANVAFLPDDRGLLRSLIALSARPEAFTIAVLPARGGAGASTLAVALMIEAVHLGRTAILIDADPLGGGIGHRVNPELLPPPDADGTTLPGRDTRLFVVSWEEDDVVVLPKDSGPVAVELARRQADVVIVDCQRYPDPTVARVLNRADLTLLVTGTDDHSMRCARRVLTWVREFADHRIETVARTTPTASTPTMTVAERLGLCLAAEITNGNPYPAARSLLARELARRDRNVA
jgi:hypothetical protein